MDRRERVENLSVALIAALEGWQAKLWTALPGIVTSFDAAAMTVEVRPAIKARVRSPDANPPIPGAIADADNWWWVEIPLLINVPVIFPSGGGFSLTFPIAAGDEALVVFAARCIDDWWQSGGVGVQADFRMHDLSDGFAIVGPRSKPRAIAGLSANSVQMRSDDGSVFVEVKAGVVNVVAGAINLGDAGLHKLIDERFKTLFDAHVHSGVQGGGGNSGPPTVPLDLSVSATSTTKAK